MPVLSPNPPSWINDARIAKAWRGFVLQPLERRYSRSDQQQMEQLSRYVQVVGALLAAPEMMDEASRNLASVTKSGFVIEGDSIKRHRTLRDGLNDVLDHVEKIQIGAGVMSQLEKKYRLELLSPAGQLDRDLQMLTRSILFVANKRLANNPGLSVSITRSIRNGKNVVSVERKPAGVERRSG